MATAEAYASLFSGDELDYAIAHALGSKYRGTLSPGCSLIGVSVDMCVDLDDLLIPGKYTIYHYINGPAAFLTEEDGTSYEEYDPDTSTDDDAPPERLVNQTAFTVRPIYLQIYLTGGDHLYQTIMVGAKLYWRDMYSAENIMRYEDSQGNVYTHIPWRSVDLGIESSVISNSFEFIDAGLNMSLSQRMGSAAIDYVRRLAIGNANLLDFSNGFFLYSFDRHGQPIPDSLNSEIEKYWNFTSGSSIETIAYEDLTSTQNVSRMLDPFKMPLFDDIDDDIITIFRAGNNGVFANYWDATDTTHIINKIAVSANTAYTASVYLIYDPSFIDLDDSAKAFISIGAGSSTVKTKYVKLNRLASAYDYSHHIPPMEIPADAEYINPVYGGTDYNANDESSDSEFRHYNKAASDMGFYRLTVSLDPNDINSSTWGTVGSNIVISFGTVGGDTGAEPVKLVKALFTLPKVEYGVYATQYNHSWGDLYYYFTNCESFYGLPIDITHPSEFKFQDGFIYGGYKCNTCGYDGNYEDFMPLGATVPVCPKCHETDIKGPHFNAEPVAIGGGGGFVQHTIDDLTVRDANDQALKYEEGNISPSVWVDGVEKTEGRNNANKIPESYRPDGDTLVSLNGTSGYAQHFYNEATIKEMYPRYKNILFLNKQTGDLLCWDELLTVDTSDGYSAWQRTGGFVSINKPFVIRESADASDPDAGPKPIEYLGHYTTAPDRSYIEDFVGTNKFWLHKDPTTGDATLKYYDPDAEMWKAPKTEPTGIYKVQPNAPSSDWAGKFWINSTTGVMYYYDYTANPPVWKPLYAAWGSNPSSN